MDKKEIEQYLKDSLKIHIDFADGSRELVVTLTLGQDKISESKLRI